MISKKVFVDTLKAIKDAEKTRNDASRELKRLGLEIDWNKAPFLAPLLNLLRAAVPDSHDNIGWWLFEDVEHTISWEEDGKPISVNVDDPEDLYDYLMGSYSKPRPEDLPFVDLPEEHEDGMLHRGIEEVDFTNCVEAVVDYVDAHNAVIHIMRNGETKYILMAAKAYEERFGKTGAEKFCGKREMVELEIKLDPELYKKAKVAFGKVGFTVEQVCAMFLCWCALYEDEARAWIEQAIKEEQTLADSQPPAPTPQPKE